MRGGSVSCVLYFLYDFEVVSPVLCMVGFTFHALLSFCQWNLGHLLYISDLFCLISISVFCLYFFGFVWTLPLTVSVATLFYNVIKL